jgi:hypothetical protein
VLPSGDPELDPESSGGWPTTKNGQMDYLPAETFGPLPVVP